MPFILMPFVIAICAAMLIIVGGVWRATQAKPISRKPLLLAGCGVFLFLGPPVMNGFVAGVLWCGASAGITSWQLQLSRWLSSTPNMMHKVSLIPYRAFDRNFDGVSWYWLERAAEGGSTTAEYTIGYLAKHGRLIPKSAKLPEKPQELMDDATAKGFILRVPEPEFYFRQFQIDIIPWVLWSGVLFWFLVWRVLAMESVVDVKERL